MTSLRCTWGICTLGMSTRAKIGSVARIGWQVLIKSNFPSFFEHNMRFLC